MDDIGKVKEALAATTDAGQRRELERQLGALAFAQGDFVTARRAFEAVLQSDPRDLPAIRGLRASYLELREDQLALQCFQRELGLVGEPLERALLLKSVGEHFQNRLRDLDNAQKAFHLARQLDPDVFSRPGPVAVPAPVAPVEASPLDVAAPPSAPEPEPEPVREIEAPAPAPRASTGRSAMRELPAGPTWPTRVLGVVAALLAAQSLLIRQFRGNAPLELAAGALIVIGVLSVIFVQRATRIAVGAALLIAAGTLLLVFKVPAIPFAVPLVMAALLSALGEQTVWRPLTAALAVVALIALTAPFAFNDWAPRNPLALRFARWQGQVTTVETEPVSLDSGLTTKLPAGWYRAGTRWEQPDLGAVMSVRRVIVPSIGSRLHDVERDSLAKLVDPAHGRVGPRDAKTTAPETADGFSGVQHRFLTLLPTGVRVTELRLAVWKDQAVVITVSAPLHRFSKVESAALEVEKAITRDERPRPPASSDFYRAARGVTAFVLTDKASGSAWLYHPDRSSTIVITNKHVVKGAAEIALITSDGDRHAITPVLTASVILGEGDLAFMRVSDLPGPFEPGVFRETRALPPRTELWAFGFPYGMELSPTEIPETSVNSGWSYESRDFAIDLIAPAEHTPNSELYANIGINPGNSGGPVFDGNRAFVGLATAKALSSEFAILIPAQEVARELKVAFPNLAMEFSNKAAPVIGGNKLQTPPQETIDAATHNLVKVSFGAREALGTVIARKGTEFVVHTDLDGVVGDIVNVNTGDLGQRLSGKVFRVGPTLVRMPSVAGVEPVALDQNAAIALDASLTAISLNHVDGGIEARSRTGRPSSLLSANQTAGLFIADFGLNTAPFPSVVVDSEGHRLGVMWSAIEHTNVSAVMNAAMVKELAAPAVFEAAWRIIARPDGSCEVKARAWFDDPFHEFKTAGLRVSPKLTSWKFGEDEPLPVNDLVSATLENDSVELSAMTTCTIEPQLIQLEFRGDGPTVRTSSMLIDPLTDLPSVRRGRMITNGTSTIAQAEVALRWAMERVESEKLIAGCDDRGCDALCAKGEYAACRKGFLTNSPHGKQTFEALCTNGNISACIDLAAHTRDPSPAVAQQVMKFCKAGIEKACIFQWSDPQFLQNPQELTRFWSSDFRFRPEQCLRAQHVSEVLDGRTLTSDQLSNCSRSEPFSRSLADAFSAETASCSCSQSRDRNSDWRCFMCALAMVHTGRPAPEGALMGLIKRSATAYGPLGVSLIPEIH